MTNLKQALQDRRIGRTLELMRDADEMLSFIHKDEPSDINGIYMYEQRLKGLKEDLSKYLKEYNLEIKDIPAELLKYQEPEK